MSRTLHREISKIKIFGRNAKKRLKLSLLLRSVIQSPSSTIGRTKVRLRHCQYQISRLIRKIHNNCPIVPKFSPPKELRQLDIDSFIQYYSITLCLSRVECHILCLKTDSKNANCTCKINEPGIIHLGSFDFLKFLLDEIPFLIDDAFFYGRKEVAVVLDMNA